MTKRLPDHTKRIAQLVHRPGGITLDEAVTAAEQRLDGLRDRGLSDIAAIVRDMHVLGGILRVERDEQGTQSLYRMSNSLVGIAGVFGKSGLGDVALSLCTLIEQLSLARRWDQPAVQLHLDSLRLVAQDGMSAAEIAAIGTALRQMVSRSRIGPAQDRPN